MFNMRNLNWQEFESLAKDVCNSMLNEEFTRYKVGKDGGIDLKSHKDGIIVQCKHYADYSNFIRTLRKEVKNVRNLSGEGILKEYFVFTSLELSKVNRKEIFELFNNYMENEDKNIIDGTNIDDFLSNSDKKEILRKHYKLWLTSTSMIDVIRGNLNSNYINNIHRDIEENGKLFVETSRFHQAFKTLLANRAVLITGGPGVGKSITSKMLVSYLLYKDKDFEIIHISSNSVDKIVEYINCSKNTKQIIYMDDFLGRTYLNFDMNKVNPLTELFKIIEANSNKMIIINSRITILKDVIKTGNYDFNDKINHYFDNVVIDMSKISVIEKAKILYNHLFHKQVPWEHYSSIVSVKGYNKIISHPKYNPRIIEHVTKPYNYQDIQADDYYNYIIRSLNNPHLIWKEEFSSYSDDDLVFCQLLYSLSESSIALDSLEASYNIFFSNNSRKTADSFVTILERLSDSIVKIQVHDNKKYVAFVNPSILDFFNVELSEDEVRCTEIINSSQYLEQFERMSQINPNSLKYAVDIDLFELKFHQTYTYGQKEFVDNKRKFGIIMNLIFRFNYCSTLTKRSIAKFVESNKSIMDLFNLVKSQELVDYYELSIIFTSKLIEVFFKEDLKCLAPSIVYKRLEVLNKYSDHLSIDGINNFIELVTKYEGELAEMEGAYQDELFDDYHKDYINSSIDDFQIKRDNIDGEIIYELDKTTDYSTVVRKLNDELRADVLNEIKESITYFNINLRSVLKNTDINLEEDCDIEEIVGDICRKTEYEDYAADAYEDYRYESDFEEREVDELFSQYDIE